MNRREIEHPTCDDLPVLANEEQVDALKYLKDPTHCGRLRCFSHLIEDRLVCFRQMSAQLTFRPRINQQGQHHDHGQSHDASWVFEKESVGEKERVFQKAEPMLHRDHLSFVLKQHLLWREHFWVEDIRC